MKMRIVRTTVLDGQRFETLNEMFAAVRQGMPEIGQVERDENLPLDENVATERVCELERDGQTIRVVERVDAIGFGELPKQDEIVPQRPQDALPYLAVGLLLLLECVVLFLLILFTWSK